MVKFRGEDDDFVVRDNRDELGKLLNETRQSKRHDIWLWLALDAHLGKGVLDPATCNGRTMRNEIRRHIRDERSFRRSIGLSKDSFLVPDSYLKWIDNDERQYQWLVGRIEDLPATESPQELLPQGLVHLTGRDRLVAMLDRWEVQISRKAEKIDTLRQEWLLRKSGDSVFEWFEDKKDGANRRKCAWEWLARNLESVSQGGAPFNDLNSLLMYFDRARLSFNEQKLIIKQIKQRWSKKQFDERHAETEQVNVRLSRSTIELLDKLCKMHNLKRPQILEIMITKESINGAYVK